ncbi:MAG TPA: 1,2-phenylacetyl-CoA epoxidase subunit B [bacterium]|nr:1,2-phenylacetyl-CoA epoxidase subunit B [bacterium]
MSSGDRPDGAPSPPDGSGADRARAAGPGPAWERPLGTAPDVWAVFVQGRHRDMHVYAGDVHAPDAEMALVLAKESYTRRDPCVNLWVVRADHIHATTQSASEMFAPATDKSYRFGGSYRQQRRILQSSYKASYREEDQ